MSSRERSILPAFEDSAGFRESTLYLFPPELAATLRRFGCMLHGLVLEGDPYFGEPAESSTRREMGAALADAVHLRDFLGYISRQVEESALAAGDARLSLLAGELVTGLDEIVTALQEGLR